MRILVVNYQIHRKAMNIKFLLLSIFAICGCATMKNKPALERIDRWFAKEKYVVQLNSSRTPAELKQVFINAPCRSSKVDSTATAVVGAGATAPVSVTVYFSAHIGDLPDGGVWASVNSDALMTHDSVLGIKVIPSPTGSSISVTPVKRGMDEALLGSIERGKIFCIWRTFSDPWRL
jgi:hypothetical protein